MEQVVELDLEQIFQACLKRIWLILLSAVVAGVLVYICTVFFVTPQYVASASFYVNNSRQTGSEKITSSDLATSQQLVMTYVNIIKSNTVLEKVIEEGQLEMTPDTIRGMMTAESVDETELFKVLITHPDPFLAAHVANTIAEVAPAEISNIMVGSTTKVLDWAKTPTKPSSPNNTTNAIIGALAGIVLSVALIVVQTLLDVRIKGEEDLAALSEVPVLGVIPDFYDENRTNYATYGSKKKGAR
jgi:capsular polysaccharide biosynthesis protein